MYVRRYMSVLTWHTLGTYVLLFTSMLRSTTQLDNRHQQSLSLRHRQLFTPLHKQALTPSNHLASSSANPFAPAWLTPLASSSANLLAPRNTPSTAILQPNKDKLQSTSTNLRRILTHHSQSSPLGILCQSNQDSFIRQGRNIKSEVPWLFALTPNASSAQSSNIKRATEKTL